MSMRHFSVQINQIALIVILINYFSQKVIDESPIIVTVIN